MTYPMTFHQFPRLPYELQSRIWSLACAPLPYSESSQGGVNQSFLGDISCFHIYHPNNSDHEPSWSRRPPERLPSLYECVFGSLQYRDGYEDTWNLLGACVESRMTFLKMLKSEVESVPSMSEEKMRGWYWGPGMTLEEVREGLAGEIGEVIGWLEDGKGSGVFQDPTLDQRLGPHHMHAVRRGFIIFWGNVPYSESHPEVFQRPQPVMTTPTTFHQFPFLSQELQSHIWSLAALSHPEYKGSVHAIDTDINVSFLRTISDRQLQHYEPIDVCPYFPRRIPQPLPSLYPCMYAELQYLDGYQDTWNLLGACVESRRRMLKMLRKVICEIEAPEKDSNEERWFGFEPTTVEFVKACLVGEIGEVIGWLDGEKSGNGYVHS